jgi:hypothetical protein
MPGEDIGLDAKRVYEDTREETAAYVASDMGLTRVEIAGDQIGRFSLVLSAPATSVAGDDGTLVVGTSEDVLVGTGGGDFVETGFGEAVLVGVDDGTPLAVGPDGTVARLSGDEWVTVGAVTGPRRMDRTLLATGDGVVRVEHDVLALGGGPNVRDVASAGADATGPTAYAATADGLLAYDDDWDRLAGGDCTLVAVGGDAVYASSEDGLLVCRDGDVRVEDRPADAAFADLTVGESLYAATADGTLFVHADADVTPDGQGGWRSRALGIRNVVGLAMP